MDRIPTPEQRNVVLSALIDAADEIGHSGIMALIDHASNPSADDDEFTISSRDDAADMVLLQRLVAGVDTPVSQRDIDDEQYAAALRLSRGRYRRPIASARWNAHRASIARALGERAESAGTSRASILQNALARAVLLAGIEGSRPQAAIRMTRGGKTARFTGYQATADSPIEPLIPDKHLTIPEHRQWFSNRVGEAVLDDLVPGWRDDESRRSAGLTFEQIHDEILTPTSGQGETQVRADASRRLASVIDAATPRQREMIRLMARGNTTNEIARSLDVSPSTIRNQFSQLRRKLNNT